MAEAVGLTSFSPINHVALLVPSARKAAGFLEKQGFPIGPAEEWDGEGTLEIYVGDKSSGGLLLLMEPIKEGVYRRALVKRGPGVHHIAIDVLDLEAFVARLNGSGWLLHPRSLHTFKKTQTVYLARPGIPLLIEVQQREALKEKAAFITRIGLPISEQGHEMMRAIGVDQVVNSENSDAWIELNKVRISLTNLGIAG